MSGFLKSIDISSSGLTAERVRMDVISNNIANANVTRTENGGPYRRQMPVFSLRDNNSKFFSSKNINNSIPAGVSVVGITEDDSAPRMVYDPAHPDANSEGYVSYPNVNVVREMVDMITCSRAYEANVTAMNSAKNMILRALEIGAKS
ncbi:MAG TPA: flagellar basal body rod protein FlgC [Candidatus Wallbacteria bacterium]|nr:flagellar basal body rod protein FlgC [Candidatus Wallbacteria bacterium]